jgi:hypothetical protein
MYLYDRYGTWRTLIIKGRMRERKKPSFGKKTKNKKERIKKISR